MSNETQDDATAQLAVRADEPAGAAAAQPAGATTMRGGRYRLGEHIGKGGMGEVIDARDVLIGRSVAIKRIVAPSPDGATIRRFLREATVQARLEHPAIVPVHEIGCDDAGMPFFVMKKLTATPLTRVLAEGAPLQRVLRAFVDVCLAVEFAHARGVVHRDIKPANIMLGDYGEVYVLDWGVAKIVGEPDGELADLDPGSEYATEAGATLGTRLYMAPEQARGAGDVDGRADVYALGCVLFEILAGQPLQRRNAVAPLDPRPSLRVPERAIPPELDELCARAASVDLDKRVPTARELGERVQRFLDGDRDLELRRTLAREHFERARTSFAGGIDDRRTVMREAAAALALDPTLEPAAELVGRLMLEPPSETPREVVEAMVADDVRDARALGTAGMWVVAGSLAFVPLLWWMAPRGSIYPPLLLAVLVVDAIVGLYSIRSHPPRPGLVVIMNTAIMILLAQMFSPVLIAPGIAAALGMGMVLTPRFSWLGSPFTIGGLMIGSLVVPLALERVGVLPVTMQITGDGVLFRAPAVSGVHDELAVVVGALYIIALISAAVIAGYQLRMRAVAARRHLQLQAWQLSHLAPR